MARFLSDAWIDDLAATVAASAAPAAAAGVRFTLQQEVATDEGPVRYWLRVDDGQVTAGPGPAEDADVVLRADRATAVAIATGEVAAQDAMAAGRLRVGGDVAALVRHAPALAAADEALAELAGRTTYD